MCGVRVVFVEPSFPRNQREFVRALASVGAEVIGIGESPQEALDDELRGWMRHYHQVPSVVDVGAMTDAVRWIQDRAWVDRLESTIEAHILAVAQVREACTIPGTSVRTAYLCRDKPSMKDALRAAGVPTAASTAADNAEQVQAVRGRGGIPAHPQAAQRCRGGGHHPRRRPRPARPGAGVLRRQGRRLDRGGGVRRGA